MAVAVGIYLPLQLSTAILAGGLVAHFAERNTRRQGNAIALRNGTLFASGLITGEALIGIMMAIPIVATGNPDVIASALELPNAVGLLVIGGLVAYLYRVATRSGAGD